MPVDFPGVGAGAAVPNRVRKIVGSIVLAALLGGLAHVHPCVFDDDSAATCASKAAVSCPESGKHGDPPDSIDACTCICHVPVVHRAPPTFGRPGAPVEGTAVPLHDALSTGFLADLFRPPRA